MEPVVQAGLADLLVRVDDQEDPMMGMIVPVATVTRDRDRRTRTADPVGPRTIKAVPKIGRTAPRTIAADRKG